MNSKRKGQKYERKRASKGLKLTPNSGAGKHKKGDGTQGNFLVDCKTTDKTQYIVKKREVDTLWNHATQEGKYPAFLINIGDKELLLLDAGWLEYLEEVQ